MNEYTNVTALFKLIFSFRCSSILISHDRVFRIQGKIFPKFVIRLQIAVSLFDFCDLELHSAPLRRTNLVKG